MEENNKEDRSLGECTLCHQIKNLRPYGDNNALICEPCGTTPERRRQTVHNLVANTTAALVEAGIPAAADPENVVVVEAMLLRYINNEKGNEAL